MSFVDHTLCLPPHLRAYVQRVRESGPFIPPRAAVPSDFVIRSGSMPPLGEDARFSVEKLLFFVSEVTGISRTDIRSDRRSYDICRARHIASWLCRRHTRMSLPNIGAWLGGRDHTTILHACRRVDHCLMHHGLAITDDPAGMAARLWYVRWPSKAQRGQP